MVDPFNHTQMQQQQVFAVILLLSVCLGCAWACNGKPNMLPFYTAEPRLVSKATNGLRYIVGDGNNTNIHVLHLYGSSYEMGKAYGTLMKKELSDMTVSFLDYLEKQVEAFLTKVPAFLREIIAKEGLHAALDLTHALTAKYTPARFEEELKGIADGSGIDIVQLRRLNLLPELTQAHCTVLGAWGDATATKSLYHLRALDWDWHNPMEKWPAVIVYHPTEAGSHAFANMGWVGIVGSLTGFSNASVGVGEKVWISDRTDLTSRFGKPWMYALRDALQFAVDADAAITELINTKRTAAIFLGIGDSTNQQLRGIEYSAKEFNIYDWSTQPEYPGHPRLKDVIYWDKHVQPSHSTCFSGQLQQYYGKIDAETIIRNIAALDSTGDAQSAVFDYANKIVHLAYPDSSRQACDATFTRLDMNKLFAQQMQ